MDTPHRFIDAGKLARLVTINGLVVTNPINSRLVGDSDLIAVMSG
jgi:hypothetical protein